MHTVYSIEYCIHCAIDSALLTIVHICNLYFVKYVISIVQSGQQKPNLAHEKKNINCVGRPLLTSSIFAVTDFFREVEFKSTEIV